MRKFIVILTFMLLFCNIYGLVDVSNANGNNIINNDTIWGETSNEVYWIRDNVEVNATLTIKPGTIIRIEAAQINVADFDMTDGNTDPKAFFVNNNGRIITEDVDDQIVRFTKADDTQNNYWGGIIINSNLESVFNDCVIEFAAYLTGVNGEDYTAALNIYNAPFSLQNTVVLNNYKDGVHVYNNPTSSENMIDDCSIKNNSENGLVIENSELVNVNSSIFEDNYNSIVLRNSNSTIQNSTISDHIQYGIVCEDGSDADIFENTIFSSVSRNSRDVQSGIVINGETYPTIRGNKIRYNNRGIVIQTTNSPTDTVKLLNNVIYENQINLVLANKVLAINNVLHNHEGSNPGSYGYEILANNNTEAEIYNSIIWTNASNRCIFKIGDADIQMFNSNINDDVYNATFTTNTDSDGISYDSNNNFSTDPMFIAPPSDYNLEHNSPCYDRGLTNAEISNLLGYDVIGASYDVGAYESEDIPIAQPNDPPILISSIPNYVKNEDFSTFSINLDNHFLDIDGEPTESLTYTIEYDQTVITCSPLNGNTLTGNTVSISSVLNKNTPTLPTEVVVTASDGEENGTVSTTFTIDIQPINDIPTFDNFVDLTILEDAILQEINFNSINDGDPELDQTLTFTATSNNTDLIPNPVVTYVQGESNAILRYQPIAEKNGTATITLSLADNGGTATLTDDENNSEDGVDTKTIQFTITVTPVNDLPSFDITQLSFTRNEDSGNFTFNNLIDNISFGPEDENLGGTNEQNVNDYLVTPVTPELFSAIDIDNSGNLSFTPANFAYGTSVISVVLEDNGGTANNGQNLSNPKTFSITIEPINNTPVVTEVPHMHGQPIADIPVAGQYAKMTDAEMLRVVNDDLDVNGDVTNIGYSYNPTYLFTWQIANDSNFTDLVESQVTAIDSFNIDSAHSDKYLRCVIDVTDDGYGIPANQSVQVISHWRKIGNHAPEFFDYSGDSQLVNEDESITILLKAKDSDGHILSWSIDTEPVKGSVSIENTNSRFDYTREDQRNLVFTPFADENGLDSFVVKVDDLHGGIALQTININIAGANDAPTMDEIANFSIDEDFGQYTQLFTNVDDGDFEAVQNITITVSSSNEEIVPNASIIVNGITDFKFTSLPNTNGQVTFTIRLEDDGNGLPAHPDDDNDSEYSTLVTINQVNDPLTLTAATFTEVYDEDTISSPVDLTVFVTDIDLETSLNFPVTEILTYSCSSESYGDSNTLGSEHISVNVTGSNAVMTPTEDWFGTEAIDFKITDTANNEVIKTINVTFNPVNDIPVFDSIPSLPVATYKVNELITVNPGSWNDETDHIAPANSSVNIDSYQWEETSNLALGFNEIVGATSNTLTIPDNFKDKFIRCKVTIIDTGVPNTAYNSAVSNSVQVSNTIGNFIYDSAVMQNDHLITISNQMEDIPFNFQLDFVDPDADEALNWEFINTSNCTVQEIQNRAATNNSKTIEFTPELNFNGTASFTVQVTDGSNAIVTLNYNVEVNSVNDTPVNTDLPVVSGDLLVGSTLSSTTGTWNDIADNNDPATITYNYQWQVSDDEINFSDIVSATSSSFVIPSSYTNKFVRCAITATDNSASTQIANSNYVKIESSIPRIVYAGVEQTNDAIINTNILEDTENTFTFSVIDEDMNDTFLWSTYNLNNCIIVDQSNVNETNYSVKIIPTENYNGTILFSTKVTDSNGSEAILNHVIEVTPVNDNPTLKLEIPNITFEEDNSDSTLDLYSYFTDVDSIYGDQLTFSFNNSEANLNVEIIGGSVIFTPVTNWYGSTNVTFTATDLANESINDEIIVTVNNVNDTPEIIITSMFQYDEDANNPSEDFSGFVSDNDPLDILTLTATNSEHIDVVVNNYEVTFSSDQDWAGTEDIIFTITDNNNSTANQTIPVTINNVNDAPVLTNAFADVNENEEVVISIDLTNHFDDVDLIYGDNLTYSVEGNSNIGVTFTNDLVEFTPAENWNGSETIKIIATDNSNESIFDEFVINIAGINDVPTIDLPTSFNLVEGQNSTYDFTNYVNDDDNDPLTISVNSPNNLNVIINDLNVSISTVNENWNGSEDLIFTVSDNGTRASTSDTVTVVVAQVNDNPTALQNDLIITMDEDTTNSELNLNEVFSDIDLIHAINNDSSYNEVLTYSILSQSFTQENVDIQINDSLVVVTPIANFNGIGNVVFKVTDASNAIAIKAVEITINNINDTPVFTNLPASLSGNEDESMSIDLTNYISDIDEDLLTMTITTGTKLVVSNQNGKKFDLIPTPNWNGVENIIVSVTDGIITNPIEAQIAIEILPTNDNPVAEQNVVTATIQEDQTLDIDLTTIFSDIDTDIMLNEHNNSNEILNYECITSDFGISNNDGSENIAVTINNDTATFTPNQNWFGTEFISFKSTDLAGAFVEKQITVIVENVNDTPQFVNVETSLQFNEDEIIILNFNGKIEDNDNDNQITDNLVLTGNSSDNLIIQAIDSFVATIIPSQNWNGSEEITFTISDQNTRASSSINIDVEILPINDTPVVVDSNLDFSMDEDTINSSLDFENIFSDIDLDPSLNNTISDNLTFECTSSLFGENDTLGSEHIAVEVNGTNIIVTPFENWFGSEAISLKAIDSENEFVTKDVIITVINVNDAPEFNNFPTEISFDEDTTHELNISEMIVDIDNSNLALTWNNNVEIQISKSNNILSFTNINENWNGSEVVTFTLSDQVTRESVSQDLTIVVNPVNDGPTIVLPESLAIAEDGIGTLDLDAYINDIEEDSTDLTITFEGNTLINVTLSGLVATLTPESDWNGSETITFNINDNHDRLIASDSIEIDITAVEDLPQIEIAIDEIAMNENSVDSSINLNSIFSDKDIPYGDELTFGFSGNTLIAVTITDGIVSLTPDTDWYGEETLTFTATDNATNSVLFDVDVIVANVNDIPVIQNITDQFIWAVGEEDSTFTYAVQSYGLPAPSLSLEQAPEGMTIDSTTGIITWDPDNNQVGEFTVTVKADNSIEPFDTESFVMNAVNLNQEVILVAVPTTTYEDVEVSWEAPIEDYWLTGYKIYHTNEYDEDWTFIGERPADNLSFIHSDYVVGQNNHYYVSAKLDVKGEIVESKKSAIVTSYVMDSSETGSGYDDGTAEEGYDGVDDNADEMAVNFDFEDSRNTRSSTILRHILVYVYELTDADMNINVYGYGDNPDESIKTFTLPQSEIHLGWNDYLIPENEQPALNGENFFISIVPGANPYKIGLDTTNDNDQSTILVENNWIALEGNLMIRAIFEGTPTTDINISDSAIAFNDVYVGQDSNVKSFTIENNGNVDLDIDDLTIDAQFNIMVEDGEWDQMITAFTIEPLESKEIFVKFHPIENQDYSTTISIDSNDPAGTKTVSITGSTRRLIPNTFTPNNDSVNDEFRIGPFTSDNSQEAELKIYDRQGREVHSTKGNANTILKWNGKDAERDTYLYVYKIGNKIKRKGKVYLVK